MTWGFLLKLGSDLVCLEWIVRILISNKFPGNAVSPRITLWVTVIGIILYTKVTLNLTLKEKLIIKNKYYISISLKKAI